MGQLTLLEKSNEKTEQKHIINLEKNLIFELKNK
jgi:hypothetical protein